ncbi:Poly(glycerol-phosphate) alpha-glucosyltransferase GftA [Streptococcus sp. DD10]|uniref:accessory Sec system glycosyltransferase GtfA n=1 Tax=Streptococcus sp. DD10 TaxID=1777878 RepID=UPI000792D845|nr:accessory Sec system glycosyltransferase GtfA [Streptococcus sp. DD10]KXT77133.1 Poly(glycerol-phosphate) alpha-glucosyltransferase GftA [Streptococcus sp. DD10]
MTVYNLNLGIGWASSGVEYAQAYRSNLLRNIHQPAKFVFMDMILADNIQHLTSNIGFQDNEVIWLYTHFTDIKIAPTSYSLDQVEASYDGVLSRKERDGKIVRFFYEQEDTFITCYLRNENEDFVERAEFVSRGVLIRKDYYSYTRYCTEYFIPKNNQATLFQRRFYNEDGSTAYDMLLTDSQEIYRFKDQWLYGKQALVKYFMQTLHLTKSDIVILDRETGIGQAVFEEATKAHLGVVVHAEHYSANSVDEDHILWNNYYDYQFTNADKVDFFVVATERQKEVLSQQFAKYSSHQPAIYTIPVGSLDQLRGQGESKRKPFSMITASRLAAEKHIDWLVKGVALAKKELPDITFDIYGKGGEEGKIVEMIQSEGAENYISLKGHADLTDIYTEYDVYLSASTSEGFGLTLMEAIGSGLPIIGFDVPYGNQTFVKDGLNGFLLPSSSDHVIDRIAEQFAAKIVETYKENKITSMHQASYQEAEKFLTKHVEEAWSNLIQEVLHD